MQYAEPATSDQVCIEINQLILEFNTCLSQISSITNSQLINLNQLRCDFQHKCSTYQNYRLEGTIPAVWSRSFSSNPHEELMADIREWMQVEIRNAQTMSIFDTIEHHFQDVRRRSSEICLQIIHEVDDDVKRRLLERAINYFTLEIECAFNARIVSYEDVVHRWLTQDNLLLAYINGLLWSEVVNIAIIPERPQAHLPGSGLPLPRRS